MLESGSPFGPYQIVSLLGAGGMGEVYRARDSRLNRDVAIKVLPEPFATDPDRIARFTREAQTLAALSHPQIATIFGVEQQAGRHGLVMELVEGPTLADRVKTGPLDWREALDLARQIAEAVASAHERGIIHRDLKPANIKLTPEGEIKILDFGLAKALDQGSEIRGQGSGEFADSPTISIMATGAGVLLGTAAYMSPEQARGAAIDRRSDVWAFGCVLFELLTGRPAFTGDTVSDTLALVLREAPDWSALPSELPPPVSRLLARCLEKDRKRRLADLHDAALDIDEVLVRRDDPREHAASTAPRTHRKGWIASAVLAGVILGALLVWLLRAPGSPAEAVRFTITMPDGLTLGLGGEFGLPTFAPDGRTLFFVATPRDGSAGVYKTSLESFDVDLVAAGFVAPFVSPDGRWLGLIRQDLVYKVPVEGGTPSPIPGATARRALWMTGNRILLQNGARQSSLISAEGGTPIALVDQQSQPVAINQPSDLGGDWVLGVDASSTPPVVMALNTNSREMVRITDGRAPTLTATGHLVFHRGDALWAGVFNRNTRRLAGGAPVQSGVFAAPGGIGTPVYAISRTGHLAFVAGPGADVNRKLVWVDRAGQTTAAFDEVGGFSVPRLSPNGRFAAVVEGDGILVIDLERGSRVRLGAKGVESRRPVWSADGEWITFLANDDLYRQRADASGPAEPLLVRPGPQFPDAWSPDGRLLSYNEGSANRDIWLLRDGKPEPLLVTPAAERGGAFSPDGERFAYVSDESGRSEIILRRLAEPSNKSMVSIRGGEGPMWSRDGRELFYRESRQLMAVRVGPGGEMAVPRALFPLERFALDPNQSSFDVSLDGTRFLMVEKDQPALGRQQIRVILNWTDELTRRQLR